MSARRTAVEDKALTPGEDKTTPAAPAVAEAPPRPPHRRVIIANTWRYEAEDRDLHPGTEENLPKAVAAQLIAYGYARPADGG